MLETKQTFSQYFLLLFLLYGHPAQGSLDAWRNLASMHYLGDGVPKSVDLAKEIMKVVFGKK